MSYGEIKDCRSSFSYPEEKLSDERFGSSSSQSSPLLPQAIVFPYVGPAGSGPGLLGTRPGSNVTEFLIALEHHAASLKSALQVVQALKNKNEDSSSIESEIPPDSHKEDKKSRTERTLVEHMPCVFSNGLESSSSSKQPGTSLETSTKPVLSKQSSSDESNGDFDFSHSCLANGHVVESCEEDVVKTNVVCSGSHKLADDMDLKSSACLSKIDIRHQVKCSADNPKPHRLIFCSRNGAGDYSCDNMHENTAKKEAEESFSVLKKKALHVARNGLQQFRQLMLKKQETTPHCKAVEGILLCLTSLCKEEELWNMKEDFLVSLEIPL